MLLFPQEEDSKEQKFRSLQSPLPAERMESLRIQHQQLASATSSPELKYKSLQTSLTREVLNEAGPLRKEDLLAVLKEHLNVQPQPSLAQENSFSSEESDSEDLPTSPDKSPSPATNDFEPLGQALSREMRTSPSPVSISYDSLDPKPIRKQVFFCPFFSF